MNYTDPSGHKKYKTDNISDKLYVTMTLNATQLIQKLDKAFSKVWLFSGVKEVIKVFKFFYQSVKTGGSWDLKRQKNWKLRKGHRYLFKENRNRKKYFYRNDDIGNVHYGFVGSVLFSEFTLCAGAGTYQVYSDIKNKKQTQIYRLSYGDDPHDTKMIKYGVSLYKKWRSSYHNKLKSKKIRFIKKGVKIIFK